MSLTTSRSFRMPNGLDSQLTEIMRSECRTRNNVVIILLQEALRARSQKIKKVKNG